VAELQQLQQEGARCRICRSRMYLGEDGNRGNVQSQVPVPLGI